MNKCILNRKLLMAYIYGLLNNKESDEVEAHLHGCDDCKAALNQLLAVRKTMEKSVLSEKAPNDLNMILEKARKIENSRENSPGWIGSIAEKFRMSIAVKLATAGVFAAAVILVSAILLSSRNVNYLYMTRAYGDVKVNDKQLFVAKNYIYRLEISRPVKIGVGQGECEFQINKNQYFEMRPLTRILIEKGKDIIVNFLEGLLIGKVIHDPAAIGLEIATPNRNAVFNIIGTLFYVRSTNKGIEFAVKEGSVQVHTGISNRTFTVHDSEIIRVGDNFVEYLTNTNIQSGNIDKIFDKLDQYQIRDNFNDIRQIMIKTEPEGSEIFWKEKLLGKSPLFFVGSREQYRKLTVVKKGFVSREIEIGNEKEYQVAIKQDLPPEVVWNLGMNGTRFISPVVAHDGRLLVGDETGWFYKLDATNKQVVWKFKAGLRNNSLPLVAEDKVYFASTDGFLYALRYDSGEIIWKQKIGILVYSGPQFYNGKIIVGNIEGQIMSMNASDGRVLWKKKFDDGFYTSPQITDGNIYIGAMSGSIYSLQSDNGNINWQYRTGDRIISSKPIVSGKKVFFGSNDKSFYAIDSVTGKLLWRADIGGEIFTSAVEWEDNLIVCSVKGDIFSLDKKNGKVVWTYQTGQKILLNPFLVQGKYLFISAGKNLYIMNQWGILFTQYPFEFNISDYTVSSDKNVYICGSEGDMRLVRFHID